MHHTLLKNRPYTGVTLQTLHESKFDHGTILAQTPSPGLPVPSNATLQDLHDLVTPVAAEMLVQGLRDGVHVPPHQPARDNKIDDGADLSHAPKLGKSDRQIQWNGWTADDFVRHQRVLGPLWTHAMAKDGKSKRLIFEDVKTLDSCSDEMTGGIVSMVDRPENGDSEGRVVDLSFAPASDGSDAAFIPAVGGGYLKVAKLKIEGEKSKAAGRALNSFAKPAP